jgi:hypothetical protein
MNVNPPGTEERVPGIKSNTLSLIKTNILKFFAQYFYVTVETGLSFPSAGIHSARRLIPNWSEIFELKHGSKTKRNNK